MTEENRTYITHLKVTDVPWHRLTTAYGRGTDFPAHLTVLEQMRDLASVKESLYELTTNMEHQSTLWHATPFGMVFLSRILEKALADSGQNPAAHFLAGELLDFFSCILQCFPGSCHRILAEQLHSLCCLKVHIVFPCKVFHFRSNMYFIIRRIKPGNLTKSQCLFLNIFPERILSLIHI